MMKCEKVRVCELMLCDEHQLPGSNTDKKKKSEVTVRWKIKGGWGRHLASRLINGRLLTLQETYIHQ